MSLFIGGPYNGKRLDIQKGIYCVTLLIPLSDDEEILIDANTADEPMNCRVVEYVQGSVWYYGNEGQIISNLVYVLKGLDEKEASYLFFENTFSKLTVPGFRGEESVREAIPQSKNPNGGRP